MQRQRVLRQVARLRLVLRRRVKPAEPSPADDVHLALLRGLPEGGVLWLRAGGRSLWPFLRDGDSLRVERCAAAALRPGDVAVVLLPPGRLVAHVVASAAPLRTASSVGVVDPPPLEALGVVTAFKRAGRVLPWPRRLNLALRYVPGLARAVKQLPGTRRLVRRLRDE